TYRADGNFPALLHLEHRRPIQSSPARKLFQKAGPRQQESTCKSVGLALGSLIAGVKSAMHNEVTCFMRQIKAQTAQTFFGRTANNDRSAPVHRKGIHTFR